MPHPEFSERPGMLQLQGQMRKKENTNGKDLIYNFACHTPKKGKTGS